MIVQKIPSPKQLAELHLSPPNTRGEEQDRRFRWNRWAESINRIREITRARHHTGTNSMAVLLAAPLLQSVTLIIAESAAGMQCQGSL